MPEINRRQRQKLGYAYTFLSDPKAEVIRRYDLLHRGAGPEGADIARPAEFLTDSSGTIRRVNLTENIAVRAYPEQVLKHLMRCRRKVVLRNYGRYGLLPGAIDVALQNQ